MEKWKKKKKPTHYELFKNSDEINYTITSMSLSCSHEQEIHGWP